MHRPKIKSTFIRQKQTNIGLDKLYKPTIPTSTKNQFSHGKIANGFNNEILNLCRQNHLNAGYNRRMKNLRNITAENKKIHQRINSQKTLYSNEDLSKSYESNNSISRRLSQSKLSKRQGTPMKNSRQKNRTKKPLTSKDNNTYQVKTQDVKKVKDEAVKKFSEVFFKKQEIKAVKPRRKQNFRRNSFAVCSEKQIQLPIICDKKTVGIQPKSQSKNDGGILHRIAEEMFERPRIKKF